MSAPSRFRGPVVLLAVLAVLVGSVSAFASLAEPPAVCDSTWDGGGDGRSWHDGENWADDDLPAPTWTACFSGATVVVSEPVMAGAVQGGTLEVTGGGLPLSRTSTLDALVVSGGALHVDGPLAIDDDMRQTGGTVSGAGQIDVHGDLHWTAGVQSGTGGTSSAHLVLPSGGERSISGRTVAGLDVVFTGAGQVQLHDGTATLRAENRIEVDGVEARITGPGVVSAPTVLVTGTDERPGDLDLSAVFETEQTDRVQVSGPSRLRLGSPGVQQGQFELDGHAAYLVVGADQTFAETSALTETGGAGLEVAGGTAAFAGTAHVGWLRNLASVRVEAAMAAESIDNLGDLVVADGTTLDVRGADGYRQRTNHGGEIEARTLLDGAESRLSVTDPGSVSVDGGTLTGSGFVLGRLVNAAIVEPVGELKVSGDYVQDADGTLLIGARTGSWDRLVANHPAQLAGTLQLPLGGVVPTEETTVLEAAGVTGTFDLVIGDLAACGDVRYDDDTVVLVPGTCVTAVDTSVPEGGPFVRVPVTVTGTPAGDVVVDYETRPGTATDGSDYSGAGGRLVLGPGRTSGELQVPLLDDAEVEQDETFTLALTATGARLTRDSVRVTVVDDDEPAPAYTMRPMTVDLSGFVHGIGTSLVTGTISPDADTTHSWGYVIDEDRLSFSASMRYVNGVNADDDVVGECRVDDGSRACFRSGGTTTFLAAPDGRGANPRTVNRADTIVGELEFQGGDGSFRTEAALWPAPDQPPLVVGPTGSHSSSANDISESGWVAGTVSDGTGALAASRAWVRNPDGVTTEIGTLPDRPDLPDMEVTAVGEDGTVFGIASDGTLGGEFAGWEWREDRGFTVFTGHTFVLDTNSRGDAAGMKDGQAALRTATGRWFTLRDTVAPGSGLTVASAELINDDRVIAGRAFDGSGQGHLVVLLPPGAGCSLCTDITLTEPVFPDPASAQAVPGRTTDGNPVTVRATLRNSGRTDRTVEVAFLGPGGQRLADPRRVSVPAGTTSQELSAPWDTAGLAWDVAGRPSAAHELVVQVKDVGSGAVSSHRRSVHVDPRPVIAVHGTNSGPSVWSAYVGYLHERNPRWNLHAVDTMDTGVSASVPVAENARRMAAFVAERQEQDNAWHVDVLTTSLGGLVSRSYVQDLMPRDPQGRQTVRHLVMLAVPNAGTPCADIFDLPFLHELRTDQVARFNAAVTDTRGVPVSAAAGDVAPVTCHSLSRGDVFVPADSAEHGVTDTQRFAVGHRAVPSSRVLAEEFVLPRLTGTAAGPARTPLRLTAADAETEAPQLLTTDPLTLAPGASADVSVTVPPEATAAGLAFPDGTALRVVALRNGTEAARLEPGETPEAVRTLDLPGPAGSWVLRFTNTGPNPAETDARVWVRGLPTRLLATASQVPGTSPTSAALRVTARLEGAPPQGGPSMVAVVTLPDGSQQQLGLDDDGTGTFTGTTEDLGGGVHGVTVYVVAGRLTLGTTASADLRVVEDGPGDDPPVTFPTEVTTSRDRAVPVELQAVDPEGEPVSFELVDQPAHGTLGGTPPQLTYTPDAGFLGTDEFTWRARAGALTSPIRTGTIVVGPAETELHYRGPVPAEGTRGSELEVRLRLIGPLLEGVDGAEIELEFAGRTVTATTTHGEASARVRLDVPAGRHPLTMTFSGNDEYAMSTTTQFLTVVDGSAPRPRVNGDEVRAEAGYPVRVFVASGDVDRDGVRARIDWTADGTWDAEAPVDPRAQSAVFDHVYPDAVGGRIRFEVVDGAGNVGVGEAPLSVAPHRPLGRLSVLRIGDQPVTGVDVTADGSKVLVEIQDIEGEHQLPTPYALLDVASGAAPVVSVLPDGRQADFPSSGAVSDDGRFVAFSVPEDGGATHQAYLRDTSTGTTTQLTLRSDGSRFDRGTAVVDVSTDGRWVLVTSTASRVTDQDLPRCSDAPCRQVYLIDTATRAATLVSVDGAGRPAASGSAVAAMTPDATVVVASAGARTVVHDRLAGTTTALPLGADGGDLREQVAGLDVSDDGRYVLFLTTVPGLHPSDGSSDEDLFRYDRQTGERLLVSADRSGDSVDGGVGDGVLSADGAMAAFTSASSDVTGAPAGTRHVYLRDLGAGSTALVSQEDRDSVPGRHASFRPLLSDTRLLFDSDADNLVPGDLNGERDLFAFAADTRRNAPPVLQLPQLAAQGEGSVVEVVATAEDVDGDALTWTWQAEGAVVEQTDAGTARVRFDDGPATAHLRVQVSDGTGTVEGVVPVEVTNVGPTVQAGPDVTVPWGVPARFAGTVDDPSAADRAAGLSPSWSFSDGQSAAGTEVERAFAGPGTATARLLATDKDGSSASDEVAVTVTRRPTELRVASTDGPYGFAEVRAEVRDARSGPLADREVVVRVDGGTPRTLRTDAAGVAVVRDVAPGPHTVTVDVPATPLYDPASGTAPVTVSQSAGKATGNVTVAEGTASFDVQYDGRRTKGQLTWTSGATRITAQLTALGIHPTSRVAWAAGTTGDGRRVVLYLEDNGESGVGDVFRLELDGQPLTATGARTAGNVQVHRG